MIGVQLWVTLTRLEKARAIMAMQVGNWVAHCTNFFQLTFLIALHRIRYRIKRKEYLETKESTGEKITENIQKATKEMSSKNCKGWPKMIATAEKTTTIKQSFLPMSPTPHLLGPALIEKYSCYQSQQLAVMLNFFRFTAFFGLS